MASNPQQQGATLPPKPWERSTSSSGPTPFKPPSPGSTSDVVEASGTSKPGEVVYNSTNAAVNSNLITRPVPSRPWDQNYTTYGGYGSNLNYNSGYGSGNGYGGWGGSYGSGLYGNGMYRGGYGGLYGGSMYGGMYNGGFGGPMGGGGFGVGGPYGNQDPNNPYGPPPSPPGFWISFLQVMHGVVNFFGRLSMLIDQNTQAFHMFMSALLQLFDRSGMLYGELARFVFRLLGIRTKARQPHQPGPDQMKSSNGLLEGSKAPAHSWDTVWGGEVAPQGSR